MSTNLPPKEEPLFPPTKTPLETPSKPESISLEPSPTSENETFSLNEKEKEKFTENSNDMSFSDIYKTSSLLKSSTSDFETQKNNIEKPEIEENPSELQGLSLDWCLGLNTSCLNNVQNLTSEINSNIFYTSGNTGILYDYNLKKQVLFQGHTDAISSVCFNLRKNIIVTADSGESCLMVVWDAEKGVPLKTFFEPHDNGVAVIDISPCGK